MKEIYKKMKTLYNLNYITRYNRLPVITRETVSSHLFHTTMISLLLYEKYKNKIKLDLNKILITSLIHDCGETIVGDILYVTKLKLSKNARKEIETIEKNANNEMLDYKYKELCEEFENESTPEAIIVRLSDCLSCNIYSEAEISCGNKNMKEVLNESNRRIKEETKKIEKFIKCQKVKKY